MALGHLSLHICNFHDLKIGVGIGCEWVLACGGRPNMHRMFECRQVGQLQYGG